MKINHTVLERFLKYVKIDTQSDPNSPTCPSTEKQKNLGKILVEELIAIGISDAEMDEHGYVYATIPSNTSKIVPVLCLCSHMDTSPDCSGKDVNPIIHKNYQGKDIELTGDVNQIIRFADHEDLKNQIGNDIVTSDGTTLLGADNKAGIAEIMDAANHLLRHPEIKHGKIRILFTPDEEIGRGVDNVDMKRLGADFGYTIDGESLGHIEDETFSADGANLVIHGVSTHPGFAFGKMENALKIAAAILDQLPKDRNSPETTAAKQSFVHPTSLSGTLEQCTVNFILRAFNDDELRKMEDLLSTTIRGVMKNYPNSSYNLLVKEQYRNMKSVLDKNPQVVANAIEAIKRSGITPHCSSIRGGTDGSRLSFMGLPCPNIFAGGHAFHSRQEWAAVQDMEKAAEVIVNLVMIWEEKS
ncbi:MAG: peptidase T [Bacteroidetes bacterium]|nr:peptidase T [Bacteroidota bacterium]